MSARHTSYLIRNLDDEGYLEVFLVAAIVSILLVRFYLYVTGFPQIGGKGLHIAHLLWGGLLMVAGIVMLVNYVDRLAQKIAIAVAGAGLGLFLDEIGKFLTSDNNYFFRPAASLIYVIFIVLYLLIRLLQKERDVTTQEYLVNSLISFREALTRDFDSGSLERARYYLARSGDHGEVATAMRELFDACPQELRRPPTSFDRWREKTRRLYERALHRTWFLRGVTAFFLTEALITFGVALIASNALHSFTIPSNLGSHHGQRSLTREADMFFATVATLLVILGSPMMVRARLVGFRMFKIAVLVSIFLTQIFEFYDIQFFALIGVGLNLLGLGLVNTLMARERELLRREVGSRVPISSIGETASGR